MEAARGLNHRAVCCCEHTQKVLIGALPIKKRKKMALPAPHRYTVGPLREELGQQGLVAGAAVQAVVVFSLDGDEAVAGL
jgi:hypothetical protein